MSFQPNFSMTVWNIEYKVQDGAYVATRTWNPCIGTGHENTTITPAIVYLWLPWYRLGFKSHFNTLFQQYLLCALLHVSFCGAPRWCSSGSEIATIPPLTELYRVAHDTYVNNHTSLQSQIVILIWGHQDSTVYRGPNLDWRLRQGICKMEARENIIRPAG